MLMKEDKGSKGSHRGIQKYFFQERMKTSKCFATDRSKMEENHS
jgi:hypothetical protein